MYQSDIHVEQDCYSLTARKIFGSIVSVFVILMLIANSIDAQNVHSKITILKGSSVPVSFNSYTKMVEGVEYADWTRMRILYFDTTAIGTLNAGSTWQLVVSASSPNIPGDGGISPMDLNKVELLVSVVNSGGATAAPAVGTYLTLPALETPIVVGGSNSTGIDLDGVSGRTTEVIISYRIGNDAGPPGPGTNSVLGEAAGYYFVDLFFTLRKTP